MMETMRAPLRIVSAVACSLVLAVPVLAACSGGSLAGSSSGSSTVPASGVESLGVEIVATHPFDDTSFVEGLEFEPDGQHLLVSTGWEGEGRIYRSTIDGVESDSQSIDPAFFGEGITRTGDHVWQLTWKDGVAMKRDAATLEEIGRVNYQGQGWGMCHFDDRMVMSDGTNQLRVLDPDSFQERSRIDVTKAGAPVSQINELECVPAAESSSGKDEIYANVFTTTSILRIDAASGAVTGVIDASNVPNNAAVDPENVLNGIAHIPGTDRFFITGKRWPDLYEVRFVPAG